MEATEKSSVQDQEKKCRSRRLVGTCDSTAHEDGDTHHLRAQDRLHISSLKVEFYRPSVSYWLLSGPKCTADPSFVPSCSHQDCLAIYSDIPVTVSIDQWPVKGRHICVLLLSVPA